METAQRARSAHLTWQRLLHIAASINAVLLLVVGSALRDRETIAFGAIFALAVVFVRLRGGVAGFVMLGVLAINAAGWMVPAAAWNVANREQLMDVLIPASLAVISLTASVAAGVSVVRRRNPDADARAVRIVVQTAIAVFVLAAGAGLVQQGEQQAAQPGDVVVDMHSARFSTDTLTVPAGDVTFAVANRDLFWHTFTIDELGIDVGLPTRAERRVTFTLRPGTYRYYCAVPGHDRIGMEGTLTVR